MDQLMVVGRQARPFWQKHIACGDAGLPGWWVAVSFYTARQGAIGICGADDAQRICRITHISACGTVGRLTGLGAGFGVCFGLANSN